jgi:hypothetical protein
MFAFGAMTSSLKTASKLEQVVEAKAQCASHLVAPRTKIKFCY